VCLSIPLLGGGLAKAGPAPPNPFSTSKTAEKVPRNCRLKGQIPNMSDIYKVKYFYSLILLCKILYREILDYQQIIDILAIKGALGVWLSLSPGVSD